MTPPSARAQAEALFTVRADRVTAVACLPGIVGDVISIFAVTCRDDAELGAITRMLAALADRRFAQLTGTDRPDGGAR